MLDEQWHLIQLLAQLPLAPLAALRPFLGVAPSTVQRHAGALIDRGLLGALATPFTSKGRPARLLYLTRLGLQTADNGGLYAVALARQLAAGKDVMTDRGLTWMPGLLAAYELLALLAGGRPGGVELCSWQRPWRAALRTRLGDERLIPLPAAARMTWSGVDPPVSADYFLVPDTGGLALPAFRKTIGRLADYQSRCPNSAAVLAIATTQPRRIAGWSALVESVCRSHGLSLLQTQISTWTELRLRADRLDRAIGAPRERPSEVRVGSPAYTSDPACPSVKESRLQQRVQVGETHRLSEFDRAILDLVARHPFLPTSAISNVLGHDERWARACCHSLVARGLLRLAQAGELYPPALARLDLLEATRNGLAVLAAQLGLPLMSAVTHHGLAGGGPHEPLGPRATLLDHFAHTLGADSVMVAVARAVRAHPLGGELLEWRGPAGCAHGRLRPDEYGLLRLGRLCHGFFLEFDRGTMRASRLRAKFVAYHRFAGGAHARRSYTGFPTILVVTTSPAREQRIAEAARAAQTGQPTRLGVLLTTGRWIEAHPEGVLGSIWRDVHSHRRRSWPIDGAVHQEKVEKETHVTAVDQLQLDETRTGMFGAVSVRATTPVFPRTVLVVTGRGGEERLVETGRARDLVETQP